MFTRSNAYLDNFQQKMDGEVAQCIGMERIYISVSGSDQK